jgi:hypothetical protein
MWFLVLLTFFNALADNDLVLRYRFSAGGFPVGAFDILLLGLGPIAVMLSRRNAYPTARPHPILPWIFILFTAAVVAGSIGSVMSGVGLRNSVTSLRNLTALPVAVWLGYYLVLQFYSAEKLCRWHVYVGIVTACFVLLYFGRKATVLAPDGSLDTLRAMKYVAVYCGMAAVLLLYTVVSGVRLFRPWLAILLCGFCFLGQFATLSRSDWLAVWVAVVVVYFRLPSAKRGGKLTAAVIGPPVAAAFLWIGLVTASALTGTDFTKKMVTRLESMLPNDEPGVKATKAWDTRLQSTLVELKWWAGSPLIGRGFGIHDLKRAGLSERQQMGLRHNTWVATLAESGLVGFSAMALVVGGTYVVGRRMVRDWTDRGTVLVGALGVVTASIYLTLGVTTMAFNQMRGAIPLGIVCGIVLRCRAMQQTALAAQQQQQAAYAGYDDPEAQAAAGYPAGYPSGYSDGGYPSTDPVY